MLSFVITLFIVLELANVMILYFAPNFKHGNSMVVFKPWHRLQKDQSLRYFTRYLVNWVAGTKLIFIALFIVILFLGSERLKFWALFSGVFSILPYFFAMQPLLSRLDKMGELNPKGYSKILMLMIMSFSLLFSITLVVYLFGK